MDSAVRWIFEAIAKAQARRGDLRSAVATADGLTQPSHRASLLEEIGAIQVQGGRTQSALIWARALPVPLRQSPRARRDRASSFNSQD